MRSRPRPAAGSLQTLWVAALLMLGWLAPASARAGGSATPAAPLGLSRQAPPGLQQLVSDLLQRAPGQPARSVWRVTVGGQTRYYVTAPCCDQLNELYDLHGTRLCAPDGGFTGRGDGQCPQWQVDKSRGRQVWRDPRPSGASKPG